MNTNLSNTEYIICDNQGDIFETIAREYTYETFLAFVPAFMKSAFCRTQWDVQYSPFQMNLVQDNLDFLIPELKKTVTFHKSSDESRIFNPDAAHWIGFTYRQIQRITGIPSSTIIQKITLNDLCASYPGLHTISEEMSAERIINDYHLAGTATASASA